MPDSHGRLRRAPHRWRSEIRDQKMDVMVKTWKCFSVWCSTLIASSFLARIKYWTNGRFLCDLRLIDNLDFNSVECSGTENAEPNLTMMRWDGFGIIQKKCHKKVFRYYPHKRWLLIQNKPIFLISFEDCNKFVYMFIDQNCGQPTILGEFPIYCPTNTILANWRRR